MAATIKFQRYTAEYFAAFNPILAAGEVGFAIDVGKIKVGDGSTRWLNLDYVGSIPSGTGVNTVLLSASSTANAENATVGGGYANVITVSGPGSTISGGQSNTANGMYCVVSGGAQNVASYGQSVVCGGTNNTASAQYSAIVGGYAHTASGSYSIIGGGQGNGASGGYAVIGGGLTNSASSTYSFIGGGSRNSVSGTYSVVCGGGDPTYSNAANQVAAAYSAIVGGNDNEITVLRNYGFIGGGQTNLITSAGTHGTIGGGQSNSAGAGWATIGGGSGHGVIANYGTIAGGQSNAVNTSRTHGFVGGGQSNSIITAGTHGTISGGQSNTASATHTVIGGGSSNAASGTYATVGGGQANTASATHATVAGGWTNTASSFYATVPGGVFGVADRYGMLAHAAGRFAANGDAQHAIFVLRNKTTNSTPTALFTDGGSNRLTIPSGKSLFATVQISGISSNGAQAAHYVRKVAIKNVGGTTSLIGTVSTVGTDVEDVSGWDVAITADDTNDALIITVTGAASTTIRWVAVVDAVEITYGT